MQTCTHAVQAVCLGVPCPMSPSLALAPGTGGILLGDDAGVLGGWSDALGIPPPGLQSSLPPSLPHGLAVTGSFFMLDPSSTGTPAGQHTPAH